MKPKESVDVDQGRYPMTIWRPLPGQSGGEAHCHKLGLAADNPARCTRYWVGNWIRMEIRTRKERRVVSSDS